MLLRQTISGKFSLQIEETNNNLILILRAFHEMTKRALHDFYLIFKIEMYNIW